MALANQQRALWAAGLVISTTCVSQDEKSQVKHDVVASGGRYSPNLSKRTTHLLTPPDVSNVSEKLLAATTQDRYPGLHVVSTDWLKASVHRKAKADEASYHPSVPQVVGASGDCFITPAPSGAISRQPRSTSATPATAAGPQTPWVVHFSQMGDSIYGMPDAASPTGHESFVQQLQPIAELPSPPAGDTDRVSADEVAAVVASSYSRRQTTGAPAQAKLAAQVDTQQHSGVGTTAVGHKHAVVDTLQLLQTDNTGVSASETTMALGASATTGLLQGLLSPTGATATAGPQRSPCEFHRLSSQLQVNNSSGLQVIPGSTTAGYRAESSPSAVVEQLRVGLQVQEQLQHAMLEGGLAKTLLRFSAPGSNTQQQPSTRKQQEVKQTGAAAHGISSMDGLLQALPGSIHSSRTAGHAAEYELVGSKAAVARAADLDKGQLVQAEHVQPAAVQPGRPHLAGSQVESDPWRQAALGSTVDPVAALDSSLAAALVPTEAHLPGQQLQLQAGQVGVPQLARLLQREAADEDSSDAAAPMAQAQPHDLAQTARVLGSFDSVPELVAALQGSAGDSRRQTAKGALAAAAALPLSQSQPDYTIVTPSTELTPAGGAGTAVFQGEVAPGAGLGSIKNIDELLGALRRATGDSFRVTGESATADDADMLPLGAAVADSGQGISSQGPQSLFGSISNVDELILALRRATGSRRSTAESAVGSDSGELQQQEQQQACDDIASDSFETVDNLLKAISRAASDSSRSGNSDLAPADQLGRQLQPQLQQGADHAQPAIANDAGSLPGSFRDVDSILHALRRATGSRRSTAETPRAADAGGSQQQQESALDSPTSVDDLLIALRRTTGDSRRATAETVVVAGPTAPAVVATPVHQKGQIGSRSAELAAALAPSTASASRNVAEQRGLAGDPRSPVADRQRQRPPALNVTQVASSRRATAETPVTTAGSQNMQQQRPPPIKIHDITGNSKESAGDSTRTMTVAQQPLGIMYSPAAHANVQQQQYTPGSPRNVSELIGALRRVTGNGRQPTAGTSNISESKATTVLQAQQPAPNSPRNIHELVGALRRVTGSSKWETLTSPRSPRSQASGQQQQQQQVGSPKDVNELVRALRRVTGGGKQGDGSATSPRHQPPNQLQQQQELQLQTSSPRNMDGLSGQVSRAADAGVQALGSAAHQQAVDEGTAAAKNSQQLPPSGPSSDVSDLVQALRRHTGDSRRGTAELAAPPLAAISDAATLQQQLPRSDRDVQELLGELSRVTDTSQQDTASSTPTGEQRPQWPADSSSVDDLVQALRRKTEDSRRATAEATGLPTAVPTATGQHSKQQQQQQQQLTESPGDADHLVSRLGEVTGTNWDHTASSASDPNAGAQTTQQQQGEQQQPAGGSSGNGVKDLARSPCSNRTGNSRRTTTAELLSPSAAAANVADLAAEQHTPGPKQDVGRLLSTLSRVTGEYSPAHTASPGAVKPAEVASPAAASRQIPSLQVASARDVGSKDSTAEFQLVLSPNTSSSRSPYKFPTSTQEEQPESATAAATSPAAAATTGFGNNPSRCFWLSVMAVIDPAISVDMQQRLHQALSAAGATVVPGQPHLGCGATTVIAEPGRAVRWLPLLLDLVSPAWVLKACQQQQQQHRVQQLVRLSPDVARALGSTLQQHEMTVSAELTASAAKDSMNAVSRSSREGSAVLLGGAAATAQRVLMPRQLLTELTWSIDQDPRCVSDEEAAAVLFQAGTANITLLLPEDSSGLLGYATVKCFAVDAANGLTCSDVLAVTYDFYQQEVLLQDHPIRSDSPNVYARVAKQQQQLGRLVHRVELMGARLSFEGLMRATQDPHSSLYEVCVA